MTQRDIPNCYVGTAGKVVISRANANPRSETVASAKAQDTNQSSVNVRRSSELG